MIDLPVQWEVRGARVFLGLKFAPEPSRAFPPVATGESEELTGHKVARMCGHNVEKASFGFAVAQGLQGFEVGRFDAR